MANRYIGSKSFKVRCYVKSFSELFDILRNLNYALYATRDLNTEVYCWFVEEEYIDGSVRWLVDECDKKTSSYYSNLYKVVTFTVIVHLNDNYEIIEIGISKQFNVDVIHNYECLNTIDFYTDAFVYPRPEDRLLMFISKLFRKQDVYEKQVKQYCPEIVYKFLKTPLLDTEAMILKMTLIYLMMLYKDKFESEFYKAIYSYLDTLLLSLEPRLAKDRSGAYWLKEKELAVVNKLHELLEPYLMADVISTYDLVSSQLDVIQSKYVN